MRALTSLALSTLVVNWTLTVLAFIAVTAMYYHRLVGMSMAVRPDDILILVSLVVGVVLVSLSTWTILDEGQAEHQENVSGSQLELAAKSLLVAEALWTLVTGLLRIAACLLTYSIFCIKRFARCTIIIIITLSAGLAAASIIQIFLICRPFAAQWDPRVLGACGDQVASFMALESAGIVLDLGILLVPSVMTLQLHLSRERKIQILMVFNIGAIVLVVTGLRMAALRNAVSPDFTYAQSYLSLLSASGSMTGIICCSSPSLSALIMGNCVGRHMQWRHRAKALRLYISGPTLRNMRVTTGTQSGQLKEDREGDDVEKGSNSNTDTRTLQPRLYGDSAAATEEPIVSTDDDEQVSESSPVENVVEWPFTKEDGNISREIGFSNDNEINDGAIALADFCPRHGNELPLYQGQGVWIHHKRGQGWLVAHDLSTGEIGLIPEHLVQLRNGDRWYILELK